jgi:hypothetical protein
MLENHFDSGFQSDVVVVPGLQFDTLFLSPQRVSDSRSEEANSPPVVHGNEEVTYIANLLAHCTEHVQEAYSFHNAPCPLGRYFV